MIISHSQEMIFLKPRKVAGTSFEIALSRYMDGGDIITPISPDDEKTRSERGYRRAQNYQKRSLAEVLGDRKKSDLRDLLRLRWPKRFYNHMPAKKVRELVGGDVWDTYLKISIVRNPWDCVISHFYWATRHDRRAERVAFEEWCENHQEIIGSNNQQYMVDGKIVVDRFLRYENFEHDIRELEDLRPQLHGLHDTFASLRAKGGIRPKGGALVSDMFGNMPRIEALIEERCAFEIAHFGYRKQKPATTSALRTRDA